MSDFKVYRERYKTYHVDLQLVHYPSRYLDFDTVGDNVYEVYAELTVWGASGYVRCHQLAVL